MVRIAGGGGKGEFNTPVLFLTPPSSSPLALHHGGVIRNPPSKCCTCTLHQRISVVSLKCRLTLSLGVSIFTVSISCHHWITLLLCEWVHYPDTGQLGSPVCVCNECEMVGWSAPKFMTSQDEWWPYCYWEERPCVSASPWWLVNDCHGWGSRSSSIVVWSNYTGTWKLAGGCCCWWLRWMAVQEDSKPEASRLHLSLSASRWEDVQCMCTVSFERDYVLVAYWVIY